MTRPPAPAPVYRVTCRAQPEACQWTFEGSRAIYRDAAWRLHYASHARGAAIVAAARERAANLTVATEKHTHKGET